MARRPIALRASVSMSTPDHRIILADERGPVTDQPHWVSLDVLVEYQLDDGTWVSSPEAKWRRGGPLACSRHELEEHIRGLIFSEPRYLPRDPRAEPALLVEELQGHGAHSTLEALAALPLTITLSDEVEAARVAQMKPRSVNE
jgi:hypothetical protein